MSDFQTIIGLEVHVQLATKSKLFCGCPNKFGADPNTQVCPVCLGLPGALPVLNAKAIELAVVTGVALGCEIPAFTKWDRKQYFYPDLPKGYQTSQFDLPITEHGKLEVAVDDADARTIRILRAHLEEDAGKSLHDESGAGGDTVIDLNRAGTPLLEIVSEPDLRSAAEAKAYLSELKLILGPEYLGVSDCNMQEGSLRVDANVNIHLEDSKNLGKKLATPIVEIKNLNSFRAVERAIDYEAQRQYREWQETGRLIGEAPKQTRGWDDNAGKTIPQREKEESADYRYFPCPDLAPVLNPAAEVDKVRASMIELPATLRCRLQKEFEVSEKQANVIVGRGHEYTMWILRALKTNTKSRSLVVNLGEKIVASYLAKFNSGSEAHRTSADAPRQKLLFPSVNDTNDDARQMLPVSPPSGEYFGSLVDYFATNELPKSRATDIVDLITTQKIEISDSVNVEIVRAAANIEAVDESELVEICRELLQANPKIVADVQKGNDKAVGALIGQAKKKNPNADPGRVKEICLELIAKGL